jgi:hypothetical protein
MDWIRQTEFPNEPVESVEFLLYTRTQLKNKKLLALI